MSKKQLSKNTGWRRLANFFGVIGYLATVIEWTWVAALYLPLLIENEAVRQFVLPNPSSKPQQAIETSGEPSIILMVAALIITAIVTIAAVVLIIRLPMKIARTGHTAAQKTASVAIPVITHHKKVPKKKQRVLTARIIAGLKLAAAILPLFALLYTQFIEVQISWELLLFVGTVVALTALVSFTLQYTVAAWRNIQPDELL